MITIQKDNRKRIIVRSAATAALLTACELMAAIKRLTELSAATARHTVFVLPALLLMLPAGLTSCTATDDTGPTPSLPPTATTPGTATPEGGDQPGVTISLTQPRITIGGIDAEAKAGTRAMIDPDDIYTIELYVDLLDKDEKVKQSCNYNYDKGNGTGWAFSSASPLMVHGGTGIYYMRATAIVNKYHKAFFVSYSGTAAVAADGTFTFSDNLKPYASQVTVELKGADGNALTDAGDYRVVLRGMTATDWKYQDENNLGFIVWMSTGGTSCPKHNAKGRYTFFYNDGTFSDILPGTVPAKWYDGADAYNTSSPIEGNDDTQWGSDNILFSIYKIPAGGGDFELDPATGLPTNASAEYHVTVAGDKKYTLAPGKSYTFTLKLNADKKFSIEAFDDITVGDFGDGGGIEIGR